MVGTALYSRPRCLLQGDETAFPGSERISRGSLYASAAGYSRRLLSMAENDVESAWAGASLTRRYQCALTSGQWSKH